MKVLHCEQCDEPITEDSFGLEFDSSYFCSDTCLHDYVDMLSSPILERDFELYGDDEDEEETDEDDEDEEETDEDDEDEEETDKDDEDEEETDDETEGG